MPSRWAYRRSRSTPHPTESEGATYFNVEISIAFKSELESELETIDEGWAYTPTWWERLLDE